MYSTHPSEFPSEPLPVMIDPTLLVFSLLLLLIVALGAFAMGRRNGYLSATDHHGKHREGIYKAVAKAAEAAMKASRNEVLAKGEALYAAIQSRLGDVLALGSTIDVADELRQALDGRGASDSHDPGLGRGSPVIINSGKLVLAGSNGHNEHPPAHNEGGHGEGRKALSHDETIAAVRRAIERVADHWSDKPARLDELRRAQIQLSPPH